MNDTNRQYKIRSWQNKIDYAMRKVKENETALEGLDELIERELVRGIRDNDYRLSLARLVVRIHESRICANRLVDDEYEVEEYKLPEPSKEALRLSQQAVKMMQEIDALRDDMWEWSEKIKELKGDD